jgi:hypothetical protein
MQRAEAAMVHTQRDTHVNNPTFGAATSPAPIMSSDVKYILSRRNITSALPARPGQGSVRSRVASETTSSVALEPEPDAIRVHCACEMRRAHRFGWCGLLASRAHHKNFYTRYII